MHTACTGPAHGLLQIVEDQKGATFARFQQILLSLSDRVGQRVFMSALWVVRVRTGRRLS